MPSYNSNLNPLAAGHMAAPHHAPKLERGHGVAYMPIEAFKDESRIWFCKDRPVHRTFLSSGTTKAERSRAQFSEEGLRRYQTGSLSAFFAVLARLFRTDRPEAISGISLIPTVKDWPDSSLAQMVAWISERAPVTYCDEGSLAATIAESQRQQKPVWMFGTAFHLLNAIDARAVRALPPGSIVVETGGTKGKAREVTRTELFREIAAAFAISEDQIVSEYGMCELASQAYDWVDPTKRQSGDQARSAREADVESRTFRFPDGVKLRVMISPGEAAGSGEGVLLIDDPLRIDYPWPLRTEDMVRLFADGSFQLLGRVPASPLKGCSLGAERALAIEVGNHKNIRQSLTAPFRIKHLQPDLNAMRQRAEKLQSIWSYFLQSEELLRALTAEFGSQQAASQAVADLYRSCPDDAQAWVEIASTALGGAGAAVPQRWLMILPQNHSLVGFYPLVTAFVAGLQLCVRIPPRFGGDSAICLLAKVLRQADADLELLAPSWRLLHPKSDAFDTKQGDFDAALVYASDETLADLAPMLSVPVRSFGSKMGLTWLHSPTESDLAQVAIDALGLGQTGCMSTRLVLASGIGSPSQAADFAQKLAIAGGEFWRSPLPQRSRAALEVEQWRYLRREFRIEAPEGAQMPMCAWYFLDVTHSGDELTHWLNVLTEVVAARPFCLPILALNESDPLKFVHKVLQPILATKHFGTATCQEKQLALLQLAKRSQSHVAVRALGMANAPKWDGTHEGKALFAAMPK